MAVMAGYKQTEVGVIPEDWNVAQLNEVADKITVGFVGSMAHLFRSGGVPLLRGQNVLPHKLDLSDTKYISSDTNKLWKKSSLHPGDVVMVRVGYPGTSCVIPDDLGEANAASLIVVSPTTRKLDSDFLCYVLNSEFGTHQIESYLVGGAQQVINTTTAAIFQLPLPTKAEQEAIAEVLSDADALLESLEQLITKKRHLKQGAMQELLTGKKRLPGFSGEWEVKRIGDLLIIAHGKSQQAVADRNGIYPILATGGQIGTANRFLYDKPSVLIGRKGTIDRPQYMDRPFWTVDTLFYSVIHEPNSAKFVFYRFCLIDWKQYNEASGVPSLNARTIERIELKVPPPAEQTAIATILSDMDAEIAALEEKLVKTRSLKQGMMHNLLTGRIRLV